MNFLIEVILHEFQELFPDYETIIDCQTPWTMNATKTQKIHGYVEKSNVLETFRTIYQPHLQTGYRDTVFFVRFKFVNSNTICICEICRQYLLRYNTIKNDFID
jgi:hypothetical protein